MAMPKSETNIIPFQSLQNYHKARVVYLIHFKPSCMTLFPNTIPNCDMTVPGFIGSNMSKFLRKILLDPIIQSRRKFAFEKFWEKNVPELP